MTYIALFASGRGSNAEKIIDHFKSHEKIRVGLVISNKKQAGVHEIARNAGVPSEHISKAKLQDRAFVLDVLSRYQIRFVVLAGFLLLVPEYLTKSFEGRIVNIHPALLPKYGGKGMYGMHVHRAVKAAGEPRSGMTVHHVNPKYDEGLIIFQSTVPISSEYSPEEIAKQVLVLEHRYYAKVIESTILNSNI